MAKFSNKAILGSLVGLGVSGGTGAGIVMETDKAYIAEKEKEIEEAKALGQFEINKKNEELKEKEMTVKILNKQITHLEEDAAYDKGYSDAKAERHKEFRDMVAETALKKKDKQMQSYIQYAFKVQEDLDAEMTKNRLLEKKLEEMGEILEEVSDRDENVKKIGAMIAESKKRQQELEAKKTEIQTKQDEIKKLESELERERRSDILGMLGA